MRGGVFVTESEMVALAQTEGFCAAVIDTGEINNEV